MSDQMGIILKGKIKQEKDIKHVCQGVGVLVRIAKEVCTKNKHLSEGQKV